MPISASKGHITAFFKTTADCQNAIDDLRNAGFAAGDMIARFRDETSLSVQEWTTRSAEPTGKVWDNLVDFFATETAYDVYGKEKLRPESYRTAGHPCHGGYALEQTTADGHLSDAAGLRDDREQLFSRSEPGTMLSVTATDRVTEVKAILLKNRGDLDPGER